MPASNVPTSAIADSAAAAAIDRLENFLFKIVPYAKYQYVTVTFNATANLDSEVQHTLRPRDFEAVDYQVVKIDKAGVVYNDTSATRRAWTTNTIVLRCSAAGATATLLLTLRPS